MGHGAGGGGEPARGGRPGPFSLIPAFSRWEKEGVRPRRAARSRCGRRHAGRRAPESARRCSLSQRERVRVREKACGESGKLRTAAGQALTEAEIVFGTAGLAVALQGKAMAAVAKALGTVETAFAPVAASVAAVGKAFTPVAEASAAAVNAFTTGANTGTGVPDGLPAVASGFCAVPIAFTCATDT
jgi:hypothetical protein